MKELAVLKLGTSTITDKYGVLDDACAGYFPDPVAKR
jgi:hypothetical protein